MRQHNQRLYRLALSLVGHPDDAEDMLQDRIAPPPRREDTFSSALVWRGPQGFAAVAAGLRFNHRPGGTLSAGMKIGLLVGQAGISSGL